MQAQAKRKSVSKASALDLNRDLPLLEDSCHRQTYSPGRQRPSAPPRCSVSRVTFFAVTLLQGLIALNNLESYVPAPFHTTMLIVAICGFSVVFNTLLAKRLPLIESLLLVLY